MDEHLYTTKGPPPNTLLWRPHRGSSVILKETDYRPFSHVVRTVHFRDALASCAEYGIAPKPIVCTSTLNTKKLYWQRHHPCRNLHVLWFGTKLDGQDENKHDWYGNVEFAVPIDVMMQRWKNFYLVEMISWPTQTATRILVTNSDYSSVLPRYDPRTPGGPWRLTPDGRHERLVNCRRFNNNGNNKHGHNLEFLIEVTPFGMRKILEEAALSFKNHELARSDHPLNCHRHKRDLSCPAPFTRDVASKVFFKEHHRLNASQPMATPRLSESAEKFRQRFLAEEEIPRPVLPAPPSLLDQHFPPVALPKRNIVVFSKILQQCLQDGKVASRQLVFGFWDNHEFRIIAESIFNSDAEEEEREDEIMKFNQQRHPRMPLPYLPLPPPPGIAQFPPPMYPPPLHLPPPPMYHPPLFQHSWAPLQPILALRHR